MSDSKNSDSFIANGSLGVDKALHNVCKELGFNSYGYVPDYWNYDEKIYTFRKIKDATQNDCDVKAINDADSLIAFRINAKKTGRAVEKLVTYINTGKYEWKKFQKPENSSFQYFKEKKPILIIWDLSEESIPESATKIKEFLNKNKISKIMVSGPIESTWKLHNLDGENLIKKVFRNVFIS
jgi:hypothetical protein